MRPLILFLGITFLQLCTDGHKQGDQFVCWVNSSRVSCAGRAPAKCLQVQKSETMDPSAWTTFNAAVLGFDFEPGYIYKLLVKEHQPDSVTPSADSSSSAYTLVEILEKRADVKFRINGSWTVRKIAGKVPQEPDDGNALPRLEIHVEEMRYLGNDGCNNFNGGIIELDEQVIRLGVAAATRMMCPEMSLPDLFNASIPAVQSWKIEENNLLLFNAEGMELMQLSKSP